MRKKILIIGAIIVLLPLLAWGGLVITSRIYSDLVIKPVGGIASSESVDRMNEAFDQEQKQSGPILSTEAENRQQLAAPERGGNRTDNGREEGKRKQQQPGNVTFRDYQRSRTAVTSEEDTSTFSLDTDRTSYQLALNWSRHGYPIDPTSIRTEEWINSISYQYPEPGAPDEFGVNTHLTQHPLEEDAQILSIGLQAPGVENGETQMNVTLVMDASGSMSEGNRIEIAREAATTVVRSMNQDDLVSVVHFNEWVIHEHTVESNSPGDQQVLQSIAALSPNRRTNVQAGLDLGVTLADRMRQQRPQAVNYVILMSDGVANVDATNPFAILDTKLQAETDRGELNPLRLVTIGVGIGNYNDFLLEQLAQHGNGWYRYLDTPQQARETFQQDNWDRLATPFADAARAQVRFNPVAVKTWRLIGYENRIATEQEFQEARREFAEIPSGTAVTALYEITLAEGWNSKTPLGALELRWQEPSSRRDRSLRTDIQPSQEGADAWPTERQEDLLQLGVITALAADRYSSLTSTGQLDVETINKELGKLQKMLRDLGKKLGHPQVHQDITETMENLIDHGARWESTNQPGGPVEQGPDQGPNNRKDSGYSP